MSIANELAARRQQSRSIDAFLYRVIEVLRSARGRAIVYACLIAGLAGVLMFWRLGAPAMDGDEATYSMEVDTMRASGNWLDVYYLPGRPYFQKPPLYLWLTASTQSLLGNTELSYRAWSALFGVGTVVATVFLGSMMFGPEVGLLAALILLTNTNYLINHGARTGTFDTGLSFCFMLAMLMVWKTRRAKSQLMLWVLAGILLGLACLFKPLAGLPMLFLLGIVAFLPGTDQSRRRRLGGLAVATVFMLLVAAPWYIAEVVRHGKLFIDVIFWNNLVARAFAGLDPRALNGRAFYWITITRSSTMFALFIPAMALSAVIGFGRRNISHLATLIVVLGWVLMFSISASKYIHYAYPVFPMIAIAIGALLVSFIEWLMCWIDTPALQRATRGTLIGGLAAILLISCSQFVFHKLDKTFLFYQPWQAFKLFQPAIDTGRAQVAFVGFPADPGDWWPTADIRSSDHFYLKRMQPMVRINSKIQMEQLLAEHTPTLLVMCRASPLSHVIDAAEMRAREDQRFSDEQHGLIVAGIDFDRLWHASIHDSPSRSILRQIEPTSTSRFENSFSVLVDPPIATDAWVTADVQIDPGATQLQFTASADGAAAAYCVTPQLPRVQRLAAHVSAKTFTLHTPVKVTFRLSAIDTAPQPIRGTIQDITFAAYPSAF